MIRYHPILVALHWILAGLIVVALLVGGAVMAETPNADPEKLGLLRNHMIVGIAILILMLVRLAARVMTERPPHADIGNPVLNRLGSWTHWAFYLLVVALGASGLALASLAGLPAILFGGSGEPLPADFDAFGPRPAHGLLASLLELLILGHVAAFVYHQFARKDGLFRRMWFGRRSVGG